MQTILIALAIGVAGGMLGALFGVGGGIIMVPALLKFTDLTMKEAVATSLAIIIITSLVATASNATAPTKLIDWRTVAIAGTGAALAAYFGSGIMRQMNNVLLTQMFAVFMILMGGKMLWDQQRKAAAAAPAKPAAVEQAAEEESGAEE